MAKHLRLTGWSKKWILVLLPITSPNANNFRNSFTDRLNIKFAIKSTLNVSPQLTSVATLPCEISKNCHTQGLSRVNCHVKLSDSKLLLKNPCLVMIQLFHSYKKIFLVVMLKIP